MNDERKPEENVVDVGVVKKSRLQLKATKLEPKLNFRCQYFNRVKNTSLLLLGGSASVIAIAAVLGWIPSTFAFTTFSSTELS